MKRGEGWALALSGAVALRKCGRQDVRGGSLEAEQNRPRPLRLEECVLSRSVRSHELYPARLLCPWGFSRQKYWSGLLCPTPGDFPNPGIEPRSPSLQADSLRSEPAGKREGVKMESAVAQQPPKES